MRQAADILASPAAMQIRQLEACELLFFFVHFHYDIHMSAQCNKWPSQGTARSSLYLCSYKATWFRKWQGLPQRVPLLRMTVTPVTQGLGAAGR